MCVHTFYRFDIPVINLEIMARESECIFRHFCDEACSIGHSPRTAGNVFAMNS